METENPIETAVRTLAATVYKAVQEKNEQPEDVIKRFALRIEKHYHLLLFNTEMEPYKARVERPKQ